LMIWLTSGVYRAWAVSASVTGERVD
jgi:hypothetical protein